MLVFIVVFCIFLFFCIIVFIISMKFIFSIIILIVIFVGIFKLFFFLLVNLSYNFDMGILNNIIKNGFSDWNYEIGIFYLLIFLFINF